MWVGTLSLFFPGALGANNGSQSKCFWLQWARGNSTQWAQKWKLMMSSPESDGSRGPGLTVFLQSTSGNLLEHAQLYSGDPAVHLVPPPLKYVHLLAQRSQVHLPPGAWKICLLPGTGLYSYNPSLLTTCPAIEKPAVGSWWWEGADGSQSSRNFSLVWWTGSQKTLPKG